MSVSPSAALCTKCRVEARDIIKLCDRHNLGERLLRIVEELIQQADREDG